MYDVTKPAVYIVIATPQLVEWLLSMNTHNRQPRMWHIRALARDMLACAFLLTNQGVGVGRNGVLLDGQNRLLAMREANYPPVQFVLVLGLEPEAQFAVDRGLVRTLRDMFCLMLNKTVRNSVIAATRVLLSVRDQLVVSQDRPTLREMADKLDAVHEPLTAVLEAAGSSQRAPVLAALVDYATHHDLEAAIDLATQIRTGERLAQDDPAYRLRAILAEVSGGGGAVAQRLYRQTVSACIAHANGRKVRMLREATSWDGLPKKLGKAP